MKRTFLFTLALAVAMTAAGTAVAELPAGKVAVVQVTSVDGIAGHEGAVKTEFMHGFSFDGSTYTVNQSDVSSLDDVQVLLMINHREDTVSDGVLVQKTTQKVRTFDSTHFTSTDIPNKTLPYQVASVAGSLRLIGEDGYISCPGGNEYHIWRVDSVSLVDRTAIQVQ